MIVKNIKILSQNVHKNSLIVNTLLETQTQFDIILIQEPPWSEIRKVSSYSNSEGNSLIGTSHHPNWIAIARSPSDRSDLPRVISYVNICLSSLRFLLCKDIINHRDISLISFFNNNICYYIMNVYSDSSHTALKYLKDTEVNIENVLLMTGDFNIRDSLWDSAFPFHSSVSNDLIIIADSFNLSLSTPNNPCPTRYSDMAGEANSVINLMFLCCGSHELDCHSIHPGNHLSSDHAPLSIDISIIDEVIQSSKLTIHPKSDQESVFVKEVILSFKSLDTSVINDSNELESIINQLGGKTPRNQEYPNIPNSGGQMIVVKLSTTIEHQEVLKIGRTSRGLFLMKKFKKSPIKEKALGN